MATFPFDFRLRRFGIAIALYPADGSLAMQIQRAPDSGGSPDTGNAEVIDVVAPGTRTYVDLIGGTKHYRHRHISASGTTGDWTHWVSATATNIPAVLPNVPKLRDPSIAVQETIGSGSFSVTIDIEDPDRRINSEIAFQTRTGTGAYGGSWLTSWDTSTGTVGTDGTLQRIEAVSFGTNGRAALKFRVQWLDDAGEQQEEIRTIGIDSENVIRALGARWVPVQRASIPSGFHTTYDLYVDLQIGGSVASVHWEADATTPPSGNSGDEDISADGELALDSAHGTGGLVRYQSDETIEITVTPYDAAGGAAGAGVAGPSRVVKIEPWGTTGSTGVRVSYSGTDYFGDKLVAGTNVSITETDGRPQINAGVGSSTLTDISDVTITTPADNEVLAYDSGSGEWINQTAAEAGLAAVAIDETITGAWTFSDFVTFGGPPDVTSGYLFRGRYENAVASDSYGILLEFEQTVAVGGTAACASLTAQSGHATGAINVVTGVIAVAQHLAAGTIGSLRAFDARAVGNGAGLVTNAVAFHANEVSTTATNAYAFYSQGFLGTHTNRYGIYLSNVSGASTLNYAIYTNDGVVRFGDVVELTDGSASAPALTNEGDTDTGIFWAAANHLAFAAGGEEKARMSHIGSAAGRFSVDNSQFFVSQAASDSSVDWDLGNCQTIGNSGSRTITFANGQTGGTYILIVTDAIGAAASWTWPATVDWRNADAPAFPQTVDDYTMIQFYYNGTNYLGSWSHFPS